MIRYQIIMTAHWFRNNYVYQEKRREEKSNRAKARAEARATKALKKSQEDQDNLSSSSAQSLTAVESVEVLYHQGMAGTGQPFVRYPQLHFKPFAMFALGSPIGMFMTVRWVRTDTLYTSIIVINQLIEFSEFHYQPKMTNREEGRGKEIGRILLILFLINSLTFSW